MRVARFLSVTVTSGISGVSFIHQGVSGAHSSNRAYRPGRLRPKKNFILSSSPLSPTVVASSRTRGKQGVSATEEVCMTEDSPRFGLHFVAGEM